jgi:hypothetical protein
MAVLLRYDQTDTERIKSPRTAGRLSVVTTRILAERLRRPALGVRTYGIGVNGAESESWQIQFGRVLLLV